LEGGRHHGQNYLLITVSYEAVFKAKPQLAIDGVGSWTLKNLKTRLFLTKPMQNRFYQIIDIMPFI
jgi:hypothetical protein